MLHKEEADRKCSCKNVPLNLADESGANPDTNPISARCFQLHLTSVRVHNDQ